MSKNKQIELEKFAFSIQEINYINRVLIFTNQPTGEIDANGRPIMIKKTYGTDQICQCRRFLKGSEPLLEEYQKKLDAKSAEIVKKIKENEKKEAKASKSEEKDLMSDNAIWLQNKVNQELQVDKDINRFFAEDKHEVDLSPKVLDVIRYAFTIHRYEADDKIATALLKLFGISEE